MVQLITQAHYKKMPWKNKKGITSQICIQPQEAQLENLSFDFRLSSAPIKENAGFSLFKGMNRILIPIKGKGFYLNGALYELHEVAHFSGDEETQCDLVNGEVVDLGLIFNPQKYSAHVKIMSFKNNFFMNADLNSLYLVYVLRGTLQINDQKGLENETFLISEEEKLNFSSSKNTTMALFKLDSVK